MTETQEPLFDNLDEERSEPKDTADIAAKIGAIGRLEKEIGEISYQQKEATAFYDKKKESRLTRIAFLKSQISNWLSLNDRKNISTHLGTACNSPGTTVEWPPTEKLLQWAKAKNLEIRVVEEPIMQVITDYIKKTGEIPDGYTETPRVRLRIGRT
jgi:hypothetical protein